MKTIFPFLLFVFVGLSTVYAQKNTETRPISPDVITVPVHLTGNSNYQAALSEEDFKNGKYVFYTDSNSTVAYIRINGIAIRMTGGPNEEKILAYSSKEYTVTFSTSKKSPLKNAGLSDDSSVLKVEGALTIYNSKGQVLSLNVTGKQVHTVKN